MTDDPIEQLLRRYQPAEPPAALRARIVATRSVRPAWPWLTAAAALVMMTAGFHAAAARERSRLDVAEDRRMLDEVTAIEQAIGTTGTEGRALAERIALDRELTEMLEQQHAVAGTTGAGR